MRLISPAFQNNNLIPSRFASKGVRGGANLSPPLEWSEAPAGTRSFILSMIDLHPEAHAWVHWLVINIPVQTNSLPAGTSPDTLPRGALELFNSFGEKGYGGPLPRNGSGIHRYQFTLRAMSAEKFDVSPYTSLPSLGPLLREYLITSASLMGIFER